MIKLITNALRRLMIRTNSRIVFSGLPTFNIADIQPMPEELKKQIMALYGISKKDLFK